MGHEDRPADYLGTMEVHDEIFRDVAYCRECAISMYEEFTPDPISVFNTPFSLALHRSVKYGFTLVTKRVQYTSPAGVTHDWPSAGLSFDEHCNRTAFLAAWPLGMLTVWLPRELRTVPCEQCQLAELSFT